MGIVIGVVVVFIVLSFFAHCVNRADNYGFIKRMMVIEFDKAHSNTGYTDEEKIDYMTKIMEADEGIRHAFVAKCRFSSGANVMTVVNINGLYQASIDIGHGQYISCLGANRKASMAGVLRLYVMVLRSD